MLSRRPASGPGTLQATIAERVAAGPREIAFPAQYPPLIEEPVDPVVDGIAYGVTQRHCRPPAAMSA